MAGMFITFEGVDGVGKSTQVQRLRAFLEARGFEVVCTREPGGTTLGSRLRELLLGVSESSNSADSADAGSHSSVSRSSDGKNSAGKNSGSMVYEPISSRAEALLFAADRAQHVDMLIRPALTRGAVVISDRYVDSSLAYQAGGREIDDHTVEVLQTIAIDGMLPQRTYLLDMSAEQAHARLRHRDDRMEAAGDDFFARTRQAFLALAERDPQRFCVIDAAQSVDGVWQQIERDIVTVLKEQV